MSDRDPDGSSSSDDDAESADDADDVTDEGSFEEPALDEDPLEEDPFDALEEPGETDPFVEMDAGSETIGEDVFRMLGDEETEPPAGLNIERDPAVEEVDEGVVVPKQSYCEQCPHFSEPPTVACTHPGTTIHELVDLQHFRVSDCPVVEEQRTGRVPGE